MKQSLFGKDETKCYWWIHIGEGGGGWGVCLFCFYSNISAVEIVILQNFCASRLRYTMVQNNKPNSAQMNE